MLGHAPRSCHLAAVLHSCIPLGACTVPGLPSTLGSTDTIEGYPAYAFPAYGAAELVVGGIPVREDTYVPCSFDDSGTDQERLRVSFDVDHFAAEFRTLAEGRFDIASGAAEASWDETTNFTANSNCGHGHIDVIGVGETDRLAADHVIWGIAQVELCTDDGSTLDISGRFTVECVTSL